MAPHINPVKSRCHSPSRQYYRPRHVTGSFAALGGRDTIVDYYWVKMLVKAKGLPNLKSAATRLLPFASKDSFFFNSLERERKTHTKDNIVMPILQGHTRTAFLCFFGSHIPITFIVDGQAFIPRYFYPQVLRDLVDWYAATFKVSWIIWVDDGLVIDPPIFLSYISN